jgi:hypothetical protein
MIINLNEYGIIVSISYGCKRSYYDLQCIRLSIVSDSTYDHSIASMSFYKRHITNYRYSTYDNNNKFINILIKANIIEICKAEICLSNEILLQLI